MKREGPCCHCGITYTPLWRSGPREKPVLCNACGSRWRIRGTLVDYIPKHATKDNQGKKPKYGAEVTEPELPSVCFEDDTTNRSSLGSTESSETCIHTENINGSEEFKIWDRESIPRHKRSVLNQWVLSPVARLHKDLLHIMCQQERLNESEDEDVLIYDNVNIYSSPPETALGAILLQSPNPATNKNKPESSFTEGEKNPESPIPEKENNPESSLSGKENKPESPLPENENNPESPLPENENKPESPLPENKTSCSTDVSLGQLTS